MDHSKSATKKAGPASSRESFPKNQNGDTVETPAPSGRSIRTLPQSGYLMLKSFEVENFRGFKSLTLSDLKTVNILVGRSAAGKTTLLEAIRLALGATPQVAWNLAATRGLYSAGSANSQILR